MTLEQFIIELKALLKRAEDAGLDMDEVIGAAEHILERC